MNKLGVAAEQRALAFVKCQGLTLLESNYRCRYGEIDIICRDQSVLVFIEVRFRANLQFGGAAASVTARKQYKILRAAQNYLMQHGNQACRFDVIAFDGDADYPTEWIKNAFDEQL